MLWVVSYSQVMPLYSKVVGRVASLLWMSDVFLCYTHARVMSDSQVCVAERDMTHPCESCLTCRSFPCAPTWSDTSRRHVTRINELHFVMLHIRFSSVSLKANLNMQGMNMSYLVAWNMWLSHASLTRQVVVLNVAGNVLGHTYGWVMLHTYQWVTVHTHMN